MRGELWLSIGGCLLIGVAAGVWLERDSGQIGPDAVSTGHSVVSESATAEQGVSEAPQRPSLARVLEANGAEQFRLLASFLPEATLEEVEALVELPKPEIRGDRVIVESLTKKAWEILLARWMELAPLDALTFIRHSDGLHPLESWCFYAWSLVDPLAALREAERPPREHLFQIISALTERHLDEALAVIHRYPENDALRKGVLGRWARKDGRAALAYVDGLSGVDQESARSAVLSSMARVDSRQALQLVLSAEDAQERQSGLLAILSQVIADDPELAEKHVRDLPLTHQRFEFTKQIAKERAKVDPAAAMSWAKELKEPHLRQAAVAAAFKATKYASLDDRLHALRELGLDQVLTNPAAVSRVQRPSGSSGGYSWGSDLRSEAIEIVEQLAARSPREAVGLIAEFPYEIGEDFPSDDERYESLTKGWLKGDDRETFPELLPQIPESAWPSILRAATKDANAGRLAWLGDQRDLLGHEKLGPDLAKQLAERWMEIEPMAASQWIADLETGPAKDRAVETLISSLTRSHRPDHEAAFLWSQTLSDPATREQQVRSVYSRWQRKDAAAAAEAVHAADLEPELRDRLLGKQNENSP